MKNKLSLFLITILMGGLLYSCSSNPSGPSNKSKAVINGTIMLPDGNTPLGNATVYIAKNASSAKVAAKVTSSANNSAQAKGCRKPNVPYKQYACTKSDGSFSLNVKTEGNSVTLNIFSGEFKFSKDVRVNANGSTDVGSIAMPTGAKLKTKIAVVTGSFDSMQDVLAKSGLGKTDASGKLILGSEKFQLYGGDFSLVNYDYPGMEALFKDSDGDGRADALDYDIIFLNCGVSKTFLQGNNAPNVSHSIRTPQHIPYQPGITESNTTTASNNSKAVSVLRKFVKNGGTLYVTDRAYDYLEQAFPSYINFYGSKKVPADQPESLEVAEVGVGEFEGFKSTKGTILQKQLTSWLKNVQCSNQSPCLNIDGTIKIDGFMAGWAVMQGFHKGAKGKTWLKGDVSYDNSVLSSTQQSAVKPLMVSFKVGKGKVIYSSFHTEETPTKYFSPQERALQYLVFYGLIFGVNRTLRPARFLET